MYWDAQITSLTLRMYSDPEGYKSRDSYIAVAQIELFSTGGAFMHAILKKDGKPISMSQWNALAAFLLEKYNIKTIKSERHGREVTFDTVKLAEKFYKSNQENTWQPQPLTCT